MSSEKNYVPDKIYDLSAFIASGTTDSAELDLEGTELAGIFVPSSFTGTAISIKAAAAAGGSFVNVQSSGADFSVNANANKYVPIENLALIAGLRFIKICSNASETADRTIVLAVRPI